MLDSLKSEVSPSDAITILFDGAGAPAKAGWSDSWKEGCACPITVHTEPSLHGYWGHPLRSKWQTKLTPVTTFIMHADDDDVYHAGFLQKLRDSCTDPNTLYFAKMRDIEKKRLIPVQHLIQFGNVGTPCGIVPWALAGSGTWANRYGGDADYYKAVAAAAGKPPVFLPHLIYEVNPQ